MAIAADERPMLAALVGEASLARSGPSLVRVRDPRGGEEVDEALLLADGAGWELHLHGSEAVLARLEQAAGAPLVLSGEPGAEPAERLLHAALDEGQLALALEQLELGFDRTLEAWLGLPRESRAARAQAALERSRGALALARAERLVLVGRQNAGKSTLMNRLLFRERVLAGPRAGLTRDPVAEQVVLGGYPYILVDTAGEGDVHGDTDRRALGAARRERASGRTVAVVDGSRGPQPDDGTWLDAASLVVATHADLPPGPWPLARRPDLLVDAADPARAVAIRAEVGERLRLARGLPVAGPAGGLAALDEDQLARLGALADGA